ncbi:hypothetical protein [Hymenobacter sp. YC55]|uniref:hypothetical protein n=1 Tax=Hymenobacter sp. YC55 TaxID=3034019 RepID=UPI0023F78C8B|nr:hypothetical protein [Hymenobacter sp. YC55]MDF7810752.1 hypothetical protein [Hymenobacter sp. YC55]
MESSSIQIQLAAIEVPEPKKDDTAGVIYWGAKHSFMPTLLDLIRHSPTAAAMTRRRALFVAGSGFTTDADLYPVLAAFLKNVASTGKYRTANKLLRQISKDESKIQAWAMQVVWSKDGKYITELYPQKVKTVAPGPMNEEEEVEYYMLCRDWSKQDKFPPQRIAAFNPRTAKQDKVQLYFWFAEDSDTEYFPELELAPVLNYMKIEGRLSKYHDNRVATRFGIDTIITIQKGPVDEQDPTDATKTISAKSQRDKFTEGIKQKFQGEDAESIFFIWGDGSTDSADKMAKVQSVTTVTAETFKSVAEEAQQAIMSVGGVTSPAVIGLPGSGSLGGNASEIREAYEMYFNSVCKPVQVSILEAFYDDILPYVKGMEDLPGLDEDEPALDIITNLPVKFMFSESTLENILDDDELRSMINYGPAKTPEDDPNQKPQLTEAQAALSGSVGGQSSIDAMLSLLAQKLTTRESCVSRLKIFYGMTEEEAQGIVPQPSTETVEVAPGTIK